MRSLSRAFAFAIAGCSSDPNGTLLAAFDHPTAVFVDDEAAYVTGSSVFRVPLDGGVQAQLTDDPSPVHWVDTLAMDETTLYVRHTSTAPDNVSLSRVPKDGSPATTIVGAGVGPVGIDDSFVYYATTSSINRVAKDGSGAVEALAPVTPNGLGVDALAVDEAFVYWAAAIPVLEGAGVVVDFPAFDSVQRVAKTGGLPETLTTSAEIITALAVDATGHAYWCDSHDPLRGVARFDERTRQIDIIAGSYNCGGPIRFDETHVYWPPGWRLSVMALPLDGGTPTLAASGAVEITDFVVHAGKVYFLDWEGATSRIGSLRVRNR